MSVSELNFTLPYECDIATLQSPGSKPRINLGHSGPTGFAWTRASPFKFHMGPTFGPRFVSSFLKVALF